MTSEPPSPRRDQPDSKQQQPDRDQILAWLSTQSPADNGETPPPLPEDLLKELQDKFGAAPAPIPAPTSTTAGNEEQGLLGRLISWLKNPIALGLSAAAIACVVLMVTMKDHSNVENPSSGPVWRGGKTSTTATDSSVNWIWVDGSEFAMEKSRLGKEGIAEGSDKSAVQVTLDAKTDPLFVLVTGSKNGVFQPDWSLRLPKLPADSGRPDRWLQALLQLQEKIDATP